LKIIHASARIGTAGLYTCYTGGIMQTGRPIVLVVLALLVSQTVQAQQDYLAQSFELYQAGRYQESIEASRKLLKESPNSAAAYNNIAVSYLGLKKYDEAVASAEQALRVQPDFSLAANNLAWIWQEKARSLGLVTLPPSSAPTPESYLDQSIHAYQRGQFQECVTASHEALRLRPTYAEAYNNIGACSASLGKWDDAIRNAQEALRLKPDYPLAKNNLAWAQQQKLAQGAKKQ
jgi:Flp pilus assembly protein TadD